MLPDCTVNRTRRLRPRLENRVNCARLAQSVELRPCKLRVTGLSTASVTYFSSQKSDVR